MCNGKKSCSIYIVHVVVVSKSIKETKEFGVRIGRHLKGGEVIELMSDLGGGKTTFVHGLAKGIGSDDHVASPTFTISRLYQGKTLEMHHFDFYRLPDAGLMAHELHDIIGDPAAVVVVEWGDVVSHVLPSERLTIRLVSTGEESRRLEVDCPESLTYLVKDLA
jgi:tRNA threonylcarbamoyladenosine biosynthesis protein TsaE